MMEVTMVVMRIVEVMVVITMAMTMAMMKPHVGRNLCSQTYVQLLEWSLTQHAPSINTF